MNFRNTSICRGLQTVAVALALSMLVAPQLWAESSPAIAVTVIQVKYEQRNQLIKNSGRISQKNEMRLAFKTAGLIAEITAEEGDEVVSGQILASLDLEEIEAQQKLAASNYKKAAIDLERFTKLHAEKLVSLQVKQNAQSTKDSAAAELQIVNFNKKLSIIRAPVDGRILKRYVESNELIQAGLPAFLLASKNQGSVVRVGLIDQDVVKVTVGDPADVFLDAYPSLVFTGTVSEIAMSTDSRAGTFEVEVLVADQGYSLRSGLIARVEIKPLSSNARFYIPIESVFKAENGSATVFVLDKETNTANEVSIEIVAFFLDEIAVRGDLKVSDWIIKLGAPYLRDGIAVSVVDRSNY